MIELGESLLFLVNKFLVSFFFGLQTLTLT